MWVGLETHAEWCHAQAHNCKLLKITLKPLRHIFEEILPVLNAIFRVNLLCLTVSLYLEYIFFFLILRIVISKLLTCILE